MKTESARKKREPRKRTEVNQENLKESAEKLEYIATRIRSIAKSCEESGLNAFESTGWDQFPRSVRLMLTWLSTIQSSLDIALTKAEPSDIDEEIIEEAIAQRKKAKKMQ